MTPLQARKQLLLVESAVNRAQLLGDCAALSKYLVEWKHEVHSLTTAATGLVNGVKVAREVISHGKMSLISTLFTVARSGLSFWGKSLARIR